MHLSGPHSFLCRHREVREQKIGLMRICYEVQNDRYVPLQDVRVHKLPSQNLVVKSSDVMNIDYCPRNYFGSNKIINTI